MSISVVIRSSSVPTRYAFAPARRIDDATAASRASHLGTQPLLEERVAGVDEQLLAGLRVLDQDQAEFGRSTSIGIDDADGDHLVPVAEPAERLLPVDVADEVGDDEDQAAPAGGGRGQAEHRVQVGAAPVRLAARRVWSARGSVAARGCGRSAAG